MNIRSLRGGSATKQSPKEKALVSGSPVVNPSPWVFPPALCGRRLGGGLSVLSTKLQSTSVLTRASAHLRQRRTPTANSFSANFLSIALMSPAGGGSPAALRRAGGGWLTNALTTDSPATTHISIPKQSTLTQ